MKTLCLPLIWLILMSTWMFIVLFRGIEKIGSTIWSQWHDFGSKKKHLKINYNSTDKVKPKIIRSADLKFSVPNVSKAKFWNWILTKIVWEVSLYWTKILLHQMADSYGISVWKALCTLWKVHMTHCVFRNHEFDTTLNSDCWHFAEFLLTD